MHVQLINIFGHTIETCPFLSWNRVSYQSVKVAMADLKTAWDASLQAEEKFKAILNNYM